MRQGYSRTVWVFGSLLIAALFLSFLHIQGILRPFQSVAVQTTRPLVYVLKSTGNSFKSFFTYFGSVAKVSRQNAELKEQVRNLQQEKVILQQYRLENERLRTELGYRKDSPLNFAAAKVISRDPTNFSQTVVIDIGADQGIKEGAAVLSEGVLVGRVSNVQSFTSSVMLVTDPQSKIDAQISSSGDNGILRGSYGSGMVLDMISQNASVVKGDEVVTFGLTGSVPKGLLIGTVGEFQSQKNDILQKVTIIPSVDLKGLYFVSVVKE